MGTWLQGPPDQSPSIASLQSSVLYPGLISSSQGNESRTWEWLLLAHPREDAAVANPELTTYPLNSCLDFPHPRTQSALLS